MRQFQMLYVFVILLVAYGGALAEPSADLDALIKLAVSGSAEESALASDKILELGPQALQALVLAESGADESALPIISSLRRAVAYDLPMEIVREFAPVLAELEKIDASDVWEGVEALLESENEKLDLVLKSVARSDGETGLRAKRILLMREFGISPLLYEKIGHLMGDYDKSDWKTRREFVIQIERLLGDEGVDVLKAIVVREKDRVVKETAGAALLRIAILVGKDFSIIEFLKKHDIIAGAGVPAITAEVYKSQAMEYFDKDDYAGALRELMKAHKINPKDADMLYNIACCHSMLGNIEKALDFLELAVENGFSDFEHAREDSDLAPLRESPRFDEILKKISKQETEPDK